MPEYGISDVMRNYDALMECERQYLDPENDDYRVRRRKYNPEWDFERDWEDDEDA